MGGFYNPYARSVASQAATPKPQSSASAAPRVDNKPANPFSRPAGK